MVHEVWCVNQTAGVRRSLNDLNDIVTHFRTQSTEARD